MPRKNFLKKCGNFILDLIFPISCLGCGEEGKWICRECFEKIKLLQKQACPICGADSQTGSRCFNCRNKSELDGVVAAAAYWHRAADGKEIENSLVKEAIHIFKYRFVKDLAKPLSGLMAERFKNRELFKKEKPIPFGPDISEERIVVPVPLHPKRFRWRGFNQAELLAENLAKKFDLPLEKSVLLRSKNNIPQVEIKERRARLENIRDAFGCAENPVLKNKTVILVDDVCTTAGTLSECAKVLKKSGAKEVWGVVVARG
jgi:competence protein ComFC